MFNEAYIILIILGITMALFVSGLWRYDIIALLALALSVAVGAIPYSKVFSGLANPAVITVACVMIISQVIHQSNLLTPLAKQFTRFSHSPTLQVGLLSITTAFFSAFMNNVGALSLMMPIAVQSAIQSKRSPTLVLLPIALASGLGGLLTLIGTPSNLLIANFRAQALGQPFEMFDFFRVGIFVATFGVLFIALVGWRLIPGSRKSPVSLEEKFAITDYITEIKIPSNSNFIDKTFLEMEKSLNTDYVIIALIRNKNKRFAIDFQQKLMENDILIIETSPKNLETLLAKGNLELVNHEDKTSDLLNSEEMTVVEATIPPGSRAVNRSAKQIRLRARYSINLIGIAREGSPIRERLYETNFKAGDVVLLHGSAENINQQIADYGLLPLEQRNLTLISSQKKWLTLGIFISALVLAALQLLPVAIAFSGAILALVLTRTIQTRQLYEAIEWPVIILLAAMIPVGEALQATGGTDLIANLISSSASYLSPLLILSLLFIVTMTLSDFMNNAATTVVMAPIAIGIAQALHANIDPFLMTVAVAASCSFLTPVGHQNNTIVMGPGGYKFMDYVRVGFPLEVLILLTAVPAIFFLWPVD